MFDLHVHQKKSAPLVALLAGGAPVLLLHLLANRTLGQLLLSVEMVLVVSQGLAGAQTLTAPVTLELTTKVCRLPWDFWFNQHR